MIEIISCGNRWEIQQGHFVLSEESENFKNQISIPGRLVNCESIINNDGGRECFQVRNKKLHRSNWGYDRKFNPFHAAIWWHGVHDMYPTSSVFTWILVAHKKSNT
jgi:hypothetical protein